MPDDNGTDQLSAELLKEASGLIAQALRAGRTLPDGVSDADFLAVAARFERAHGRKPTMLEIVQLVMQPPRAALGAGAAAGPTGDGEVGEEGEEQEEGEERESPKDNLAWETIGGLGPETDEIHPSPDQRNYTDGKPDAPNPENPDPSHPSVPATTHGYGSKILYEGEIIETWP